MENYKLPLCIAEAEFTEKKSRFIGKLSPVSSEEEALSFLKSVREAHREASHNVYAYRLKQSNICRHSDDGEPSGSAGMPLLDVFQKQDIYDFCCVATRYYGGINLGVGGLVRAYARCATVTLDASEVGIMQELALCVASMAYPYYEPFRRLLRASNVKMVSEDFGTEVKLRFSLPSGDLQELQNKVTELTAGTVLVDAEDIIMGVHAAVSFLRVDKVTNPRG